MDADVRNNAPNFGWVYTRIWKWVVTTNSESVKHGLIKQHFAYDTATHWSTMCGRYLPLAEPVTTQKELELPRCRICARKAR